MRPRRSTRCTVRRARLRVIDEKTVYLRMPPTFMEPEACLMVLRNLMLAAHDRDVKGEPPPAPKAPPAPAKKPVASKGRI